MEAVWGTGIWGLTYCVDPDTLVGFKTSNAPLIGMSCTKIMG